MFTEETKNSAKAVVQVSDAASVAYLLDGWEETMLWSYLQGYMGRAYAVGMPPRSAQVLVGSFCFFSGQPEEALVRNIPPDFQEECLLMVPRQSAWQPLIEAVYAEHASRIQRYAIKKEPWVFDRKKLIQYTESIPEGYRLAPIDEKIYFETKKAEWSHDLTSQFSSYEQYRKYGLGIAALCGRKLVAGASSYTVYDGGIEIQIDTELKHRRKGLAAACGAKLILECLERGLYPSWDAHDRRSAALAEKLGYHVSHSYITYCVSFPKAPAARE